LKSDTIRLSSPDSYNDPYDCWLKLSDDLVATLLQKRLLDVFVKSYQLQGVVSAEQIENARKNPEPLKAMLAHIPEVGKSAGGNPKKMAELSCARVEGLAKDVALTFQQWRKQTKVCSFCEVNDSMLMWGH